MATTASKDRESADLVRAAAFARRFFSDRHKEGLIRDAADQAIEVHYTQLDAQLDAGQSPQANMDLPSAEVCWSCKRPIPEQQSHCSECGAPMRTPETDRLRYLVYVCHESKRFQADGILAMTEADACLASANRQIVALRRQLDGKRIPMAVAVGPAEAVTPPRPRAAPPRTPAPMPKEAAVAEPRRPLLEMLLDPRSIQWLMASGGALLVVGLVIWLAAAGIFENKLVIAACMGLANAALLAGGWAVIHYTRYQMAGRALTLLACLVMPLNLWFYDAQHLIRLEEGGHLWIPALFCCVLYAVSARLLRDPTFVYVLVGGVAMTGLLILADHQMQHFWEIAGPSTLLVCLGLACIHAERIFAEGDGPFSRRRFGLAFFWSGHVVLLAGLLLLFGAYVCGDWLYNLFEPLYAAHDAGQPAIVTTSEGRLLALCLVLAGTYAYVYSDLVVRRIGVYLYLGVLCLLWAEVLTLHLLNLSLPVAEVAIISLAVTALLANLGLSLGANKDSHLLRFSQPLGLLLGILPVIIGVLLHLRATSSARAPWHYTLTGTYVAAMLTAAISCRASAYLFRHTRPGLSLVYFFGTGAATLTGAAGLLLVIDPEMTWQKQAPLLMIIPLLYLAAARLYRGHTPERPLLWVARAATAVLLLSSIGACFRGFGSIEGEALNLALAVFFAEATLFYVAEAIWRKHDFDVYAATVTACAAVWQLLRYAGVSEEYYILTFAVVGVLLLLAYRFAVLEKWNMANLARAAFHSGNTLLSLAFAANTLLVLSKLLVGGGERSVLVSLLFTLLVLCLLAVALLRQPAWRRWYTAASITNAALVVLVLAILGELTRAQKLEIACVTIGTVLLVAGHLGWYREQDQHNDLVSTSLFFGAVLVAVPLTVAVLYCRYNGTFDTFHTINEVGLLTAGLLMLGTGYVFRIRATTLSGACMCAVYLLSLVLFLHLPDQLKTTAVYIMIGGGLFFLSGLLLSLYRDRLLALPSQIKRREGIFRVLAWR